MDVTVNTHTASFRPWRPELGRVFEGPYAFDSETTLIDMERPWMTPTYVLGAVCASHQGFFLTREHAAEFFALHQDLPVVMHSAAFDLAVVHTLAPQLDIYGLVDRNLVWDTRLLHQLYTLATEGHTAMGKGRSTLERCAEHYLGVKLPKDLTDSHGRDVRTSYSQWLGRPAGEIEPIYLEYLAKDVIVTQLVYERLIELIAQRLSSSHTAWGYVGPEWLHEQVSRWGPLTHHIQLRGEIVLQAITANGLGVDLQRHGSLVAELDHVLDELRERLRQEGYAPGQKGSGKALQDIVRQLERRHPGLSFPRTATGQFQTTREALADLASQEPFVRDLLDYRETEKLRTTFAEKMGRQRLHPSFRTLMVTGRTSSFGEINAQNLPRDERVRSCFVPSEEHVLLIADYSTVELATLSQAVLRQFGVASHMADAINAGQDLHRLVAARVTGKPEADVTKEERQKAKPINFGKPGGMGNTTLQRSARASYGIELTDEEVERLSQTWLELFPEMRHFLYGSEQGDLGVMVARLFELTPLSHFEHIELRSFLTHPENEGRESQPHRILGWMCLKTLRDERPVSRAGEPYDPATVDYFWSKIEERLDLLPRVHHRAVRDRRPSIALRSAVNQLADRGPCFTFTGRLREEASFAARHNTLFQGLAADGAKLALWKLWRAGYMLVNFIHDEVLIELPQDCDLAAEAENVRQLMIEGMREVVPDVRIDVEYAVADRWSKAAKPTFDAQGRLVPWRPPEPAAQPDQRTAAAA